MMERLAILGFLFGCALRAFGSMEGDIGLIESHTKNIPQMSVVQQQIAEDTTNIAYNLSRLKAYVGSVAVTNMTWLKEFLTGSQLDPWYTQNPQFRFLQDDRNGGVSPANTMPAQSLVNFLSLTLGQLTQPYLAVASDFDGAFSVNNSWMSNNGVGFQAAGYNIFTVWLAEAQRRLISNTSNTTARVGELLETPQDWSSASSNAVVSAPTENDFELERPDGVEWFGEDLIEGPEWSLSGAAINPVVYSDTSRGYTLRLSFEGWGPICRALCSFLVYVGTAVCMVGIIKTEVDYWTTLGGAAT